jgi:hypothetical protein
MVIGKSVLSNRAWALLWLNELEADQGILAAAGEPDEVGLEAFRNALLAPRLERSDPLQAAQAGAVADHQKSGPGSQT